MLDELLARLPENALVLDAGAWFKPRPRATHVVDLMPYETRGCRLNPSPLPDERFSRETWHQVDFLQPGLRLPFADKFFDFSICTQTLEDLADPRPLLAELSRVSRAGYIETPSRLLEQTVGVRDRVSSAQGHPHHHWILETQGSALVFFAKRDSLEGNPDSRIPLRTYERIVANRPASQLCHYTWVRAIEARFVADAEARSRAAAFTRELGIPRGAFFVDAVTRSLRRLKQQLSPRRRTSDWWAEMLRISRPYSSIPLR